MITRLQLTILFLNKEQQQKSYAWLYSSADATPQVPTSAHKSISHLLLIHIKKKPPSQQTLLMPIHVHCCQERKGTPSRLFGNQWYKNYTLLHTFLYKHMCSCALYDIL